MTTSKTPLSEVVVVREKDWTAENHKKRFLARKLEDGMYLNTATGELFTLGDTLEVEHG